MNWIRKHPYIAQALITLLVAMIAVAGFYMTTETFGEIGTDLILFIIYSLFLGAFFIYPLVATVYEGILLAVTAGGKPETGKRLNHSISTGIYDILLLFLAGVYEVVYISFMKNVAWQADWQIQLTNAERHAPIWPETWPGMLVLLLAAVTGLFFLRFSDVKKVPPLWTVLAMAAAYLGGALCVIFTYQVLDLSEPMDGYLLLLPLNYFMILARMVIGKGKEYEEDPERSSKIDNVPVLGICNRFLIKSERWPIAAFLLMWPLLGILLVILVLFGQAPSFVIKAFTETSDFRLSARVSPQNIYVDEHYLCTVAAGGDRKIVKPIRMGVRHGHSVTVNRQLCIANAFEQVLEERTPGFHRRLRGFYDTYGFPVARMIRGKWVADLIYFFMKPLEWLFLIVLYLTEVHPEDRIALQYTGKGVHDFAGNRGLVQDHVQE